jgi:hypothetical protein
VRASEDGFFEFGHGGELLTDGGDETGAKGVHRDVFLVKSGGTGVTTAVEAGGDQVHAINRVFGAEAGFDRSRLFFNQNSDIDPINRPSVIDQSLGILLVGASRRVNAVGQTANTDPTITLIAKGCQKALKQIEFTGGFPLVEFDGGGGRFFRVLLYCEVLRVFLVCGDITQ